LLGANAAGHRQFRRAANTSAPGFWVARQIVGDFKPADSARGPTVITRAHSLGMVEECKRHVQVVGLVAQGELSAACWTEQALNFF
jgi:hypothetical protein